MRTLTCDGAVVVVPGDPGETDAALVGVRQLEVGRGVGPVCGEGEDVGLKLLH